MAPVTPLRKTVRRRSLETVRARLRTVPAVVVGGPCSSDRTVRAFEVKAAPDVRVEDTRGIRALARRLGRDQVSGVVLHTGRHGWRIDEHTFAVPIARTWTPA